MNSNDVLQLVVGLGAGGGIWETYRWFFGGGRKTAKIDNAKAVEAMAIELLTPLNDQVQRTTREITTLRHDLHDAQDSLRLIQGDMEALLAWALAVQQILNDAAIPYPPVPKPRAKR